MRRRSSPTQTSRPSVTLWNMFVTVKTKRLNIWVQAALDCASCEFLSQWPSAPDPGRSRTPTDTRPHSPGHFHSTTAR